MKTYRVTIDGLVFVVDLTDAEKQAIEQDDDIIITEI